MTPAPPPLPPVTDRPHARRPTVPSRRPAARLARSQGARRQDARRLAATANRRPRAGFTLIEMLVATTLVLLMMLLFAQVFGLATETVSMRKGMAANDQKARLLTGRFDNDLSARTFRTVAPFRGATFAYVWNGVDAWERQPASDSGVDLYTANGSTTRAWATETVKGRLEDRRGYFSISENDPDDDTDEVLSFTIDRRLAERRGGVDYSPALGRATVLDTDAALFKSSGGDVEPDQPATDQFNTSGAADEEKLSDSPLISGTGIGQQALESAQPVGVSNYEVVTFYLRNGNLVRARKLIREPKTNPTLWDTDADNAPNSWPPGGMVDPDDGLEHSFAHYFDYAAYSHPNTLATSGTQTLGPVLHSEASLDNESGGDLVRANLNEADDLTNYGVSLDEYRMPDSLGNPLLRDGAGFFPFDVTNPGRTQPFGRPREFLGITLGPDVQFGGGGLTSEDWNTPFFGRYTVQEQSHPDFKLPGRAAMPPGASAGSSDGGPLFAENPRVLKYLNDGGGRRDRRGEEILLTNVHGFDIEVYDDAIGDFVDLGHTRTAPTQDLFDINGDGDYTDSVQIPGDYHADRLRALTPKGELALDVLGDAEPDASYDADGTTDPHPFGNRFDTWHPDMALMGLGWADTGSGTPDTPVSLRRPYPPPYRPLRNPFGGDVGLPVGVDMTFSGVGLVSAADLAGAPGDAPISSIPLVDATANDSFYDDDGFLHEKLPLHTGPGGSRGGYYVRGDVGGSPRLFPNPNVIGQPGSGDEKPLRAIRITVRYYDVQSDQMRQESFRHSFTN
ncbi:prepilin-type N-terminal cleavage/methylation domain-containing protein [Alienimonas californiensis]|uniref:Prepilin-type N-terminal cleavage/methylation domain-containing protein n=1 Tax=Alienimonas californiensis TaxID=2527989 RepID=A0A517P7J9_9PLAN|nr:prepilin-type N-terminal cleavage/methylation domain-containing protein [Alienimonas californiensis]QDT15356.1 hypothetical protein CA12_14410 [Alienimonas californiensis]